MHIICICCIDYSQERDKLQGQNKYTYIVRWWDRGTAIGAIGCLNIEVHNMFELFYLQFRITVLHSYSDMHPETFSQKPQPYSRRCLWHKQCSNWSRIEVNCKLYLTEGGGRRNDKRSSDPMLQRLPVLGCFDPFGDLDLLGDCGLDQSRLR